VSPAKLSVVVAVYNEEEVLEELHRRLTLALNAIGRSFEIILVDDGSRDKSLDIMLRLQTRDAEHVRVLSFTRNFGHHIALTAGLDQANGNVVVMMDADLQDQPEEIHKLLDKIDEGYDVVWGERTERQFRWYKNLTSKLFLWVMNSVARSQVKLNSSIFRAMRKPVAEDLRQMREKARYLPGLISWLGYRETSVPVEHGKRFAGQTKYSFWRLMKLALATATSFSAAPLQLATVSGMTTGALAALFLVYIVIRKLVGGYSVPGYASVMFAILFFGALQLIVIGLMGEYISRIYGEAQGRPLYLLRDLDGKAGQRIRTLPAPVSRILSSISKAEEGNLLDAIAHDNHLPFANVFSGASKELLAQYHLEQWSKQDPHIFLDQNCDQVNAVCLLQHLPWDTKLLGLQTARIVYANAFDGGISDRRIESLRGVLRAAREYAERDGIQLVDARVSNQDLFLMRAFEAEKFHSVDMLVTLGANRQKIDRILTNPTYTRSNEHYDFGNSLCVRPMTSEDETILADLSYSAFGEHAMIQDRFFLEPSIPHERAQMLFREWFQNLARGHYEGKAHVLVAELGNNIAGYIAFEPMLPIDGKTFWKDSLNAVAPEARGRGAYRALVTSMLDYIREIGADGVITKTQSSTYRVINTWLHLGGEMYESFATLHWVDSEMKS
jgi:glycosyltransferase involved in cell wall biosynthesis/GNAT superfamily N-acetyltransferase